MTHKDLSFPRSSMTLIYAFATESHLIVIMGCWAVIKKGLNVAAHYFLLPNTHTRTSLEPVILTRSDLGVGQALGFEVTVNENQEEFAASLKSEHNGLDDSRETGIDKPTLIKATTSAL